MKEPIEKGQIIKNYKEFCELMGESVTTGNGKINQVKRWAKKYTWTRKGHSYFISDVKIQNVEIPALERLLLSHFYMKNLEGATFFMSTFEIMRELQLTTDAFYQALYDQHAIEIDSLNISNSIDKIYVFLRHLVEKTLLSLHSQSIVIYAKTATLHQEELEIPDQEIWLLVKSIIKRKNSFSDGEMYSKRSLDLQSELWESYTMEEETPKDTNRITLVDSPFNIYYLSRERYEEERAEVSKNVLLNMRDCFRSDPRTLDVLDKLT